MWRNAIDEHEVAICVARCNDAGLLPSEGTDTVLGRAASRARARAEGMRKMNSKDMRRQMADVYRRHYLTFAAFMCCSCQPYDLRLLQLQTGCTAPRDFKWFKLGNCLWWLNSTWPFARKLWTVMDFQRVDAILIDERAANSVLTFPPNGALPNIHEGGQRRDDIFVGYDDFAEICERFAAAGQNNDVIDIPRFPVDVMDLDA